MGAFLSQNIIGCLADNECYGAWWKEGATDDGKKARCCFANQIREIDAANAGYKARVTADKDTPASTNTAGPITTNEVGFKTQFCSTGTDWKDATKGYVAYFKAYTDAN